MLALKSIKLRQLERAINGRLLNNRFSHRQFRQVSTDSRTLKRGDIFFALIGNKFDGHDFKNEAIKKGASCLVVSKNIDIRGISVPVIKVDDTTKALGAFSKYFRDLDKTYPLIAVTGSSGKTTTKEIIANILSKNFNPKKNLGTCNNHIGVPLTILDTSRKFDICVLELGTNHFGEIAYLAEIAQPQVAVITNIGPSHLESFGDERGVLREKTSLLNYLIQPRILILNNDIPLLKHMKIPSNIKSFTFGIDQDSDVTADDITIDNRGIIFRCNRNTIIRLNTQGRFNIYNALAGILCGLIFGISISQSKSALENFEFPAQRLKKINIGNAYILDDTYNSNPLSLKAAIETLVEFRTSGRKILVMGDMLELGKNASQLHKNIGSLVGRLPIDIFITFGNFSRYAAKEAMSTFGNKQQTLYYDSQDEVVNFLKNCIRDGDVLLIKGSRLLKMENIVTSLINFFNQATK